MFGRISKKRKKIAGALYLIIALVSLVMGSLYLFSNSFMSYHAEAVSQNWSQIDSSFQVLILALMKVAGGGWLAIGVLLFTLLAFPFRSGQTWAIYAIPGLILIFYIPNLWATLYVLQNTPASPPWYGNLFACLSAIIGCICYPRQLDS